MIIDIWRVKTTKNRGKRKQVLCEVVDIESTIRKRKTGYKVRYICDNVDCRFSNKINIAKSETLYNSKYITIKNQLCKSCRSMIAEDKVKKSYVPYSFVKENIESKEYILLTTKREYMNSRNRSQLGLQVICPKGHRHKTIWNNWKKNKRCRQCYEQEKEYNATINKHGFDLYKYSVLKQTEIAYKKYINKIDPKKKRGVKYHLDHKFSIVEGFKEEISPIIVGSVYNLEIIKYNKNISKGSNCSISREVLLDEYYKQNK